MTGLPKSCADWKDYAWREAGVAPEKVKQFRQQNDLLLAHPDWKLPSDLLGKSGWNLSERHAMMRPLYHAYGRMHQARPNHFIWVAWACLSARHAVLVMVDRMMALLPNSVLTGDYKEADRTANEEISPGFTQNDAVQFVMCLTLAMFFIYDDVYFPHCVALHGGMIEVERLYKSNEIPGKLYSAMVLIHSSSSPPLYTLATANILLMDREQYDAVTPAFLRFGETVAKFLTPTANLAVPSLKRAAEQIYGGGKKSSAWPYNGLSYAPVQPRVAWLSAVGFPSLIRVYSTQREVFNEDVNEAMEFLSKPTPVKSLQPKL
jgi:hypothetical protein